MDPYSIAEWKMLAGYNLMTSDEARDFRESILASGLSPWLIQIHVSLLYGYGQVREEDDFPWNAFGTFLEKFPEAAAAAVEQCWNQRWIQYLSREFLVAQQRELEAGGYEMVNGLVGNEYASLEEMEGRISFTPEGIEFFRGRNSGNPDHWAIRVIDRQTGEVFGTSEESCRERLELSQRYEGDDSVQIELSEPIGRWCDRWWNRFESGHRVRFRVQDPVIAQELLGSPP